MRTPGHTLSRSRGTISVTMTTSVIPPDLHQQSGFKTEYLITIGGVGGGIILVLITITLLIIIVYKINKAKNTELTYSSNDRSRARHVERNLEDGWGITMREAETGQWPQQMSSNGASLSPLVLNSCRSRLEIPISALDLHVNLGVGDFGAVYKGTLRNLHFPHRQLRTCAVKVLKGWIASNLVSP